MIPRKAMLIDITLCAGCNACQDACKLQNKLREGKEDNLSATACCWTSAGRSRSGMP